MAFNKVHIHDEADWYAGLNTKKQNVNFTDAKTIDIKQDTTKKVRNFFYRFLHREEQVKHLSPNENDKQAPQQQALLDLEHCADAARQAEGSCQYEWMNASDDN